MTSEMGEPAVYKHSGKLGNGPWSIPIAAIPVTLLASVAYGYASVYMPCVGYLSIFLPIAYGALIAYVIARAGKAAKCRSDACLTIMGVLCGILALYAGWVSFLYALINRYSGGPTNVSLLQLFASPGAVWNMIVGLNTTGWFTIKGSTPTGILLWICWGIEALIIIGFTSLMPSHLLKKWVFCEPCDKWCTEKDDIARFGTPLPGDQTNRIKAGDLAVLAELPPYFGGKTPHIRLNNRRCDICGQTETVEIQRYWYEQTNKETNEKSEAMTQHVLLDSDALASLQNALLAQAEAKAALPVPSLTPSAEPAKKS